MITTISLTKDDIRTRRCGFNYEISVNDNLSITLTEDAVNELLFDIENIRKDGGYKYSAEATKQAIDYSVLTPGDILVIAAKENPSAIVDAVVAGLAESGSDVQDMNRALGFAR